MDSAGANFNELFFCNFAASLVLTRSFDDDVIGRQVAGPSKSKLIKFGVNDMIMVPLPKGSEL